MAACSVWHMTYSDRSSTWIEATSSVYEASRRVTTPSTMIHSSKVAVAEPAAMPLRGKAGSDSIPSYTSRLAHV